MKFSFITKKLFQNDSNTDSFDPVWQLKVHLAEYAKEKEQGTKKKRGRPRKTQVVPSTKIKQKKEKWLGFVSIVDEIQTKQEKMQYQVDHAFDNIQIVNLTGHIVRFNDGAQITPNGFLRVAENSSLLGTCNGVNIYDVHFSRATLPDKQKGVIYIVSSLVCNAYKDRDDLYIPHKINHITKSAVGLVSNPYLYCIR
jgi:hypothetical protein